MQQSVVEAARGERFRFGKNWSRFLSSIDDTRVAQARASLQARLGVERLDGKTFLDVGSGSGLFSLAARQLGATVCSFDYDPDSVAATTTLKQRYRANDDGWTVEHGSALDAGYMAALGTYDVVYAWGVLHHTGDMWTALRHAGAAVATEGSLFIAIYNDQGWKSGAWRQVKRRYNRSSRAGKRVLELGVAAAWGARSVAKSIFLGRNPVPTRRLEAQRAERGMSTWTDLVDWVGGYPFEVARPEEILLFLRDLGFELTQLRTCGGGHGCNEYVFLRAHPGNR